MSIKTVYPIVFAILCVARRHTSSIDLMQDLQQSSCIKGGQPNICITAGLICAILWGSRASLFFTPRTLRPISSFSANMRLTMLTAKCFADEEFIRIFSISSLVTSWGVCLMHPYCMNTVGKC